MLDIAPVALSTIPKNFSSAITDIVKNIPSKELTIIWGNSTNISSNDVHELLHTLHENYIQVIHIDLLHQRGNPSYLKDGLDTSNERTSLILCQPTECEKLLLELTENNFIHRTILYIFYWPFGDISTKFQRTLKEASRVAVITNPRARVFRIYYNQATPNQLHRMTLVNWWDGKLYRLPVLPSANVVYKNFHGRIFNVPVLHAPPWHFVKYNNNSTVEVTGGRDDKLLFLIAKSLNFRYQYYDPPERSQGSSISGNGTFRGTLGLIWKRVWKLVCATFLVTGPALWIVIAAPLYWQRRRRRLLDLLNDCWLFTTTLFLRQSSNKEPSSTHKARMVTILISLGATYVIGDMYSANLTSLLARPAREKPIGTLEALEEAMRDKKYELVVERHSSSLTILEFYLEITCTCTEWNGSVRKTCQTDAKTENSTGAQCRSGSTACAWTQRIAVLGGRETLYYDTERFGSHNFHLSEKLYTRYSAIALQIGCPYLETFNNVIMNLFEAGILTKMTEDEYKNLPEQSRRSEPVTESDKENTVILGDSVAASQTQSESNGLQPVSLVMLRGAFCLLGIGYLVAGLALMIEIHIHRRRRNAENNIDTDRRCIIKNPSNLRRFKKYVNVGFRRVLRRIYYEIDIAFGPE